MMTNEQLKKKAAEKAVEQIESGMVLGLGSGSTTRYAIDKIGALWQAGTLRNIIGVPTSEKTAIRARSHGIPLCSLDDCSVIDLAIDGADEVDPQLNLIKGRGGALLREKMIEMTSKQFVVIVDDSKLSRKLGTNSVLPIEVARFGWKFQARWLGALGCVPQLRGGEESPFTTDNNNYILDCGFAEGIDDPHALAMALKSRTGIIEHGLFLEMANQVIIAGKEGVEVFDAGSRPFNFDGEKPKDGP